MNARLLPCLLLLASALGASPWKPATWQGERAAIAVSASDQWVAIVSLERGRLVHLGASTDPADNLLLAPPDRQDHLGWGGHRAWLGPRADWPDPALPPAAWESSAATPRLLQERTALVLTPPPTAAAGWPDLNRGYQWRGETLRCFVAAIGPATRDVQLLHLLRLPADAVVEVDVEPTAEAPHGYVRLAGTDRDETRFTFEPPAHVGSTPDFARRAFRRVPDEPARFGFTGRPLVARRNGVSLRMDRGEVLGGRLVGEPDQGYPTQLFLGGREAFIEIEQRSPLLRPDGRPFRTFAIELTPRIER